MLRRLAPLGVAFGLLACGEDPILTPGQCFVANDCAEGQACVAGRCVVARQKGSDLCATDEECGPGKYCDLGQCKASSYAACTSQSDCGDDELCDPVRRVCVTRFTPDGKPTVPTSTTPDKPPIVDRPECKKDDECNSPTSICEAEKCVPGCHEGGTTLHCTGDLTCSPETGRCVQNGPARCTEDSECGPPNGICESMYCAPGCAAPGGTRCTGGYECNTGTGRCEPPAGCTTDAECGAPASICEGSRCLPGCALAGCSAGSVCDNGTGRCVVLQARCTTDAECGAPAKVCDGSQCVPGCGEAGGVQCSGNTTCDPAAGRCVQSTTPFCASDVDCTPPSTICNVNSGECEPGCAQTGCPMGQTCQPGGHCTTLTCTGDFYEENDVASSATLLQAGTASALTACEGDDDWYAFELAVGDAVDIQTRFAQAEGDIDIALSGPNGAVIATSASADDDERIQHTATTGGTYGLRVFLKQDFGAKPGNTYELELGLSCGQDSFEDNDTRATAATLPPGDTSGLSACPSDDDYYGFDVPANGDVTIEVSFADVDGDIDIRLYGPSGSQVASSGGTGDVESIDYHATQAGRYVLQVFLFGDGGGSPGNRYSVSLDVSTPPMCVADRFEPNDAAAAAAVITPGANNANLTACEDDDHYSVALVLGDTLTVEALFSGSDGDIDLELADPRGTMVASAGTGGSNESLTYQAVDSGAHVVRAIQYSDSGAPGVPYSLRTTVRVPTTCSPDRWEPNDDPVDATTVIPNGLVRLNACDGNDDWVAFELTRGEGLTIETRFLQSEGDIDIYVYDDLGDLIVGSESTDDDERIDLVASYSGYYLLLVTLYEDAGSRPGNVYELRLTPAP